MYKYMHIYIYIYIYITTKKLKRLQLHNILLVSSVHADSSGCSLYIVYVYNDHCRLSTDEDYIEKTYTNSVGLRGLH